MSSNLTNFNKNAILGHSWSYVH